MSGALKVVLEQGFWFIFTTLYIIGIVRLASSSDDIFVDDENN